MNYLEALKTDNAEIASRLFERLNSGEQVATGDFLDFGNDKAILEAYLRRPGRGIGGSLVLRASDIFEPGINHDAALDVAAATEVQNAYFLIVDDWIDKSPIRKGQPTVHESYAALTTPENRHQAASRAVLLGMFALHASQLMVLGETAFPNQIGVLRNMQEGAMRVTAGLSLEQSIASNPELQTQQSVLDVYNLKTCYYSFITPLLSGLILANTDSETLHNFTSFGHELGLAFQLQDDLMGTFGDPNITGKPNTDDMQEGLYTYIIDTACQLLPEGAYSRLLELHGKPVILPHEAQEYRQILSAYEIPGVIAATAREHLTAASEKLQTFWNPNWNEQVFKYLSSLIAFLKQKKYH